MARRRKNGRRRTYRRRSKNGLFGGKIHRRKGRKAKRNRGGRRRRRNGRSRRRNGSLTLTKPVGALTAAFNSKTLTQAGVMALGAVGNGALVGAISNIDAIPGFLKSGPGSYALGLASAGLLSAGVGMVAPRFAGSVLAGGVMAEVARALKEFVLPSSMKGFGDYLTPANAAGAIPLGYFGDYLTPQNAASAVSLGGLSGEDTISEELASY